MIIVRSEYEVLRPGLWNECIEHLIAAHEEGGMWYKRVKGYRVYGIHWSGKSGRIATEAVFESLADWELAFQEAYAAITRKEFEDFERLFASTSHTSYWTLVAEG